jgi:hypothetical protein
MCATGQKLPRQKRRNVTIGAWYCVATMLQGIGTLSLSDASRPFSNSTKKHPQVLTSLFIVGEESYWPSSI